MQNFFNYWGTFLEFSLSYIQIKIRRSKKSAMALSGTWGTSDRYSSVKRLEVEMKRVLMFTMVCILLLSGCKSVEQEPQPVAKVYTAKTEIGDGLQLEEKWTIEGLDNDYLTKTTMLYTYSFDDLTAWEAYITELKGVLDQRIEALQGPQGSRYIIMEYVMDGNLLVVSETTDYEMASKNNEAVMMGDAIESGEYYSMSKLCENFDLQKYTLQD